MHDWALYTEEPLRASFADDAASDNQRVELNQKLCESQVLRSTSEELAVYIKSQHWKKIDFDMVSYLVDSLQDESSDRRYTKEVIREIVLDVIDDITSTYSTPLSHKKRHDKAMHLLIRDGIYLSTEEKEVLRRVSNPEIADLIRACQNKHNSFSYLIEKTERLLEKYQDDYKDPVPTSKKKITIEATKAAYRVAATQINRASSEVISAALPVGKGKEFVSSDIGRSIVSMLSGAALTKYATEGTRTEKIARELRIGGMTSAGNFLMDEVIGMVGGVVLGALQEIPIEEEIEVTVYEEETKELKA